MARKRPRREPSPRAVMKDPMRQTETLAITTQHQEEEEEVEEEEEEEEEEEKINIAINANLLQCYLCSGPLRPPLSQCTEGHVSCSLCMSCTNGNVGDAEAKCLMCRKPETVTRCRAVEHVLDGLYVSCPFRQHGCTEMIPYGSEQAHKALCAHAPLHCPISGCAGYAGKPLSEHILQDHSVVRTIISPNSLTPLWMLTHEQARVVRLRDNGDGNIDEFLVVVGDYKQVGRTLSVVRLVDDAMDDRDFKHKIMVVGKDGELSLTGATRNVKRLAKPYEPKPFLFVPNETWDSADHFRMYLELK